MSFIFFRNHLQKNDQVSKPTIFKGYEFLQQVKSQYCLYKYFTPESKNTL